MNSLIMAAMTSNAAIEAAREGARMAGQFSPINTALLTVAIGILSTILFHQRANRKMTIQVNGEVRQEFIDEMAALRGEVKSSREESEGLREEIRTLRSEVRKRDDKIDQLRDEVRSLHGVIDGMRRENLGAHTSAQRVIAERLPHSPEIDRALRSLGNVQGDAGA